MITSLHKQIIIIQARVKHIYIYIYIHMRTYLPAHNIHVWIVYYWTCATFLLCFLFNGSRVPALAQPLCGAGGPHPARRLHEALPLTFSLARYR